MNNPLANFLLYIEKEKNKMDIHYQYDNTIRF